MTSVRVAALLAALVIPSLVEGQPASSRRAAAMPSRLLVFTDTASMRIEWTVRDSNASDLVGARAIITLRDAASRVVWQQTMGTFDATGAGVRLRHEVRLPRVQRWSPATPSRYHVVVQAKQAGVEWRDSARIGFRTVSSRNGQILLNGRPLFLKANAINPPGRNIPDSLSEHPGFAREYLSGLRRIGVNIIRLGTVSPVWLDAADDVGMLVFQGHYGTPRGGSQTRAPANLAASVAWYRDTVLAPQVNHPSVIIYALTNEVSDPEIHYASDGAAAMGRHLQAVYDSVHVWDPTRLIIANAGYGFGRTGELCDLHRYWGWYYNSFLSFYSLRDPSVCWRRGVPQPITLSEVVGSYTGADGRFNLVSDTKQPDSQLNWTGHAPDAEQGPRALAYQAWLSGQAVEITRRLRTQNPALAGVAPFTILFGQWHGIRSFADMAPKPVVQQLTRSFQPILLSWESWTSHRYAGQLWTLTAHVVNDADDGRALTNATLLATVRDTAGRVVTTMRRAIGPVPYFQAVSLPLALRIPAGTAPGTLRLDGVLIRGRDTVSRNQIALTVHGVPSRENGTSSARRLHVYDPSGTTSRALTQLGAAHTRITHIVELEPSRDLLLIGREAWDESLTGQVGLLEQFVTRGGRVIILDQRPERFTTHWLPGGVRQSITPLDHGEVFPGGRPWAQGMAINPERPTHAVFDGITRDDLFLWNDYTRWTSTRPGLPSVYPVTRGYAITRSDELGRIAILANYDHGLLGVALSEHLIGRGSVLLSAFDLVPRISDDPVADRLLRNIVRYMQDGAPAVRHAYPVVADTIRWGDYASERGLVTGVLSGFLLNTEPVMPAALQAQNPVRIDAEGFWLAGGEAGGWNTRPAVQYVGRGRRPYGPYTFTSGGSYRLADPGAPGHGRLWWRVPAERRVLHTLVENPTTGPLSLIVTVNGVPTSATVAPGRTMPVLTNIPPSTSPSTSTDGTQEIRFEVHGDRRLVLRQTWSQ